MNILMAKNFYAANRDDKNLNNKIGMTRNFNDAEI